MRARPPPPPGVRVLPNSADLDCHLKGQPTRSDPSHLPCARPGPGGSGEAVTYEFGLEAWVTGLRRRSKTGGGGAVSGPVSPGGTLGKVAFSKAPQGAGLRAVGVAVRTWAFAWSQSRALRELSAAGGMRFSSRGGSRVLVGSCRWRQGPGHSRGESGGRWPQLGTCRAARGGRSGTRYRRGLAAASEVRSGPPCPRVLRGALGQQEGNSPSCSSARSQG